MPPLYFILSGIILAKLNTMNILPQILQFISIIAFTIQYSEYTQTSSQWLVLRFIQAEYLISLRFHHAQISILIWMHIFDMLFFRYVTCLPMRH